MNIGEGFLLLSYHLSHVFQTYFFFVLLRRCKITILIYLFARCSRLMFLCVQNAPAIRVRQMICFLLHRKLIERKKYTFFASRKLKMIFFQSIPLLACCTKNILLGVSDVPFIDEMLRICVCGRNKLLVIIG